MKNKRNLLILFSIFVVFMSFTIVFADSSDYDVLCSDFNNGIGSAARIIGYIIELAKWIIPLIIIVYAIIEFSKAIVSDDEKSIQKAGSSLLRKLLAGIVIFIVPTLILAILNLIEITGGLEKSDRFSACTKCILNASEYCPLD